MPKMENQIPERQDKNIETSPERQDKNIETSIQNKT